MQTPIPIPASLQENGRELRAPTSNCNRLPPHTGALCRRKRPAHRCCCFCSFRTVRTYVNVMAWLWLDIGRLARKSRTSESRPPPGPASSEGRSWRRSRAIASQSSEGWGRVRPVGSHASADTGKARGTKPKKGETRRGENIQEERQRASPFM